MRLVFLFLKFWATLLRGAVYGTITYKEHTIDVFFSTTSCPEYGVPMDTPIDGIRTALAVLKHGQQWVEDNKEQVLW